MARRNLYPGIYYLILMILSLLFIGYQTVFHIRHNHIQDEKLKTGVLDLRNVSLENKVISLRGHCEFYWNQLLTPRDFDKSSGIKPAYISVPGTWNQHTVNGRKLEGTGHATYRFIIKVPSGDRYGLKIKEFDTAYELWANDNHISVGRVAGNKKNVIPSWKREELYLEPDGETIEIVLQVANYHHRKGGPEDVMLFGKAETIMSVKNRLVGIEMFLLGFLALAFFYHLGIFFFRMKDTSNLFFSVIIFFIALRLSLTGEKLFLDFFPGISWFTALRTEYLTLIIAPLVFILFFHSMYPKHKNTIVQKGALWTMGVFSLGIILLPPAVFTYSSIAFQPFIVFVAVYLLYYLIKNIRLKENEAIFLLIGTGVMVLIAFHELLFYNKLIQTGYLSPFGLLILVFSVSYGLSGKFSNAMNETELMKDELEKYNAHLEELVMNRTKQLQEKNIQLEKQTVELQQSLKEKNELLTFRESMTGLLVHDMKNPISAILTLDEDSSLEHILLAKQAGKQLYNLIQNMMDIQKFEELRIQTDFEPNNLNTIIGNAIEQVSYLAKMKAIDLQNNVRTSIQFVFDANLIERVLVNLLLNAVTYTPDRGTVTVDAEVLDNQVRISVMDDGIGIPENYREKIFEKYGQVDSGKKSSGLGLTFSKMAIEAHQGKIGLESAEGKGSRFWFVIPNYL